MKNNDLICSLPSIITVSCSCCVLLDVLFIFNNIYFTVHIFNNHHITRKVGGDNTVGTVNCSYPCWSRQDDSNHDELGCDDVARSAPSSFGSSTPNTLFLFIASSKLKCSFTL